MTRIFKEDGSAVAVTALEIKPSIVTAIKSKEKHGYDAVQFGYGDAKEKQLNKPIKGYYSKLGIENKKNLYEVRYGVDNNFEVGETLGVDNFEVGDYVDISGVSKGKGFQGVMKRHNFSGGRASHGDSTGRRPGSIGQSAYPARVFKGMKGPGQMGNKQKTVQNLEIVKVDYESNLILVDGSVPGAKDNVVKVSISLKKGNEKEPVVKKVEKLEESLKNNQEEILESATGTSEITDEIKTEEKQD